MEPRRVSPHRFVLLMSLRGSLCVALSSLTFAWLAAACGSSSITVGAPSGVKCQVTPTTSVSSVPAAGASGTLTITTTRDCTWSVTSGASWIAITSADHGQGSGSVSYRVSANADPAPRSATLVVNDTPLPIAQDPAPCLFTVSVPNPTAPAGGESLAVTIGASAAACKWTATSLADWVTISGASSGTGSGTVNLTVRPNSGSARTGAVVVAGQTVTIAQPEAQAPCTYAIAPTSQAIAASGGTGTVTISAPAGCAWTAASNVDWVTVTGGAAGAGNGAVTFSAAANTGAARTGALTIGGKTFTVTEAARSCTFAIAPASQSVPAIGGGGSVAVTAGATCSWSAASNASWLTIVTGASGAGNGTVTFTASGNTSGATRIGTLTIAGQTFTVSQTALLCIYTVTPPSQSVPASGGAGTITVKTAAACSWTAVANVTWITVTAPASGSGNGTVSFRAAANHGGPRAGTVTVAGVAVAVSQPGS
jgi:hypothetical protein